MILPLAPHISPWIVGVCLFNGYWRTQVYRGRWGYPASWIKVVLVFGSSAGIFVSGFGSFSLEAATSLMVLAFALKLVEMRSRRDAFLIIFLSYFMVANAFLFNQTMAVAAYEFIAMIIITSALVGMNQMQSRVRPMASFWTSSALILQALPLTLILFLMFPRVMPLWSIPLPSAASTGLSEQMSPGDVAKLTRSDELAFRAVFEGAPPNARDMCWRGLVYTDFEAGTWQVGVPLPERAVGSGLAVGDPLAYEIFLEPTQNKWLFSLDTPISFDNGINLLADYRLLSDEPILSVKRYSVVSDMRQVQDVELHPALRYRNLFVSAEDNPRFKDYALRLEAGASDADEIIQRILRDVRKGEYHYTLSPPTLPSVSSIDAFWFDTRKGFCTHYAGAMVMALRMAGIPARMVGGYQGGEVNPTSQHVVVRQYQAHAWVEAWLSGRGWVRFDPTAAVAPERVEQGLNAALSSEDLASLSFFASARMNQESLLNGVLQWADTLEYRWNLWVVGYDNKVQKDVLKEWLGAVTPARVGMVLLVGGALSLLLVSITLFWRRRPASTHPVEKLVQRFAAGMARQGVSKRAEETPVEFVQRVCTAANIDAQPLCAELQAQLYDPDHVPSYLDRLRMSQTLRRIRFLMAMRRPLAGS